jgi:DNA-directed RNA polymerase subunit RPC12/RpoP
MYTSEDLWPIKCPKCFHEFTETIGQMTANENSRCPSCSLKLTRSREQFAIVLTQARAGAFNPWRDMMRLEKPV